MFFNNIIINEYHGERLGFAWIAATRGVKYIKKEDIINVNIAMLCNDIMQYLYSQSSSSRARFSLRLSSFLINGTIRIHQRKVNILFDEIILLMETPTVARQPPSVFLKNLLTEEGIFETPPVPIISTKKRKPISTSMKETPESQLEEFVKKVIAEMASGEKLEEGNLVNSEMKPNSSRSDEITLRDSLVGPQEGLSDEDLGPLGSPFRAEEDLMHFPPELNNAMEEIPIIPQLTISRSPVKQVNIEDQQKHQSSSSEVLPPQKMIVVAQVHSPPKEHFKEMSKTKEIKKAVIRSETKFEHERKEREAFSNLMKNLLIVKQRPKKQVSINRCEKDDLELTDIMPCPLPEFRICSPDFSSLLRKYLATGDELASYADSVSLLSSQSISVISPDIIQSTPSTPLSRKRLFSETGLPREKGLDEILIYDPEEADHHTKTRKLDYEKTSSVPLSEFIVSPIKVSDNEERQEYIIKAVRMSDKPLTAEEVSQKPLTKLAMAQCLNDLLNLCKAGYVNLINDDNSCKLKYILKGPKIVT